MTELHRFKRFPLSVCSQLGEIKPYEKLVEARIVEEENGLITFLPYVDPKDIYLEQHNSSVGKTWQVHNDEFSNFISKYEKSFIVDIGGGSGNIYRSFSKNNPNVKWKIIDLNPTVEDLPVETFRGYYKDDLINEGEVVVTSHFVEHQYDLKTFLTGLRSRNPKYHIFSLPNFKLYSSNNYSATIMFEHPHYLEENYLSQLLLETGWKVIEKKYYKDHSIFFATEPCEPEVTNKKFDHKQDILNLLSYMKQRVDQVKHVDGFYVFGAHFTYYYLINLGVSEDQIIAVIDNDPKKQGRRMYGTETKIIGSEDLPEGAKVFVEMGPYNEEIMKGLKNVHFL